MNKFSDVTQADFNGVAFLIRGDGATTTMKVPLSRPPILIDFQGVLPSAVQVANYGPGVEKITSATVTEEAGKQYLNLAFSEAPPSDGPSDLTVRFDYSGV